MKVLFVCPSVQYGGGEVYLFNMINQIELNNYNIEPLLLSVNRKLFDSCDIDMKFSAKQYRNKFFLILSLLYNIINIIRREKVDVVFCNGYSELGRYAFILKFLTSIKIVSIGHSNEVHFLKKQDCFLKKMKQKVDSFLVSFLDGFIVINEKARCSLNETRLEQSKIELIYNGVPEVLINHNRLDYSNELVIGRNCRMIDKKGVDNLIYASKILTERKVSNFRIILAGDGENYNDYVQLAKDLNLYNHTVTFEGHIEKDTFYKNIDILILTTEHNSNADATPLVILEAMSCNIPIITTTVGGVMELVDEKSALILENNSPEAIADMIEYVLKNNINFDDLTSIANCRYKERFTVKVMTDNTVNFLNKVNRK